MRIKKWVSFLENRDYDTPPEFNGEQIDWLKHSIHNPNNFIKNFSEICLDILEDEKLEKEDLDIINNNIKSIQKHSKTIEDRINGLSTKKIKSL